MVEIRAIQTRDYHFLWDMLYAALYDPDQMLPKTIVHEPSLAKYATSFGKTGDYGFVLVHDGQLAGAVWTRVFPETDKGYGFVDALTPELSMAVETALRGQGYGQQLLNKLIGIVQQAGYTQLSLSVDRRNQAVNLYRRTGFGIVSETENTLTMLLTFNQDYNPINT